MKNREKEENFSCFIRVRTAARLQHFSVPKNTMAEIKLVCALTFLQHELTQSLCAFRKIHCSSADP
jgi:hypothetical protein